MKVFKGVANIDTIKLYFEAKRPNCYVNSEELKTCQLYLLQENHNDGIIYHPLFTCQSFFVQNEIVNENRSAFIDNVVSNESKERFRLGRTGHSQGLDEDHESCKIKMLKLL